MRCHRLLAPALCAALASPAGAEPLPFATPPAPSLSLADYPHCQRDHIGKSRGDGVALVVACVNDLAEFHKFVLLRYPAKIRDYQVALNALELQFKTEGRPLPVRIQLNTYIKQELAKCASIDAAGDYGEYYETYYRALDRYRNDVRNLRVVYANLIVQP